MISLYNAIAERLNRADWLLSTLARDRAHASGLAIVVWFVLVLVFDLLLLGLLVATGGDLGGWLDGDRVAAGGDRRHELAATGGEREIGFPIGFGDRRVAGRRAPRRRRRRTTACRDRAAGAAHVQREARLHAVRRPSPLRRVLPLRGLGRALRLPGTHTECFLLLHAELWWHQKI